MVPLLVKQEDKRIFRRLAIDRKRKLYEQFGWMVKCFDEEAGEIAMMAIPFRVLEKLQRLSAAFRRSEIDQLEWLIDNELMNREDFLEQVEMMRKALNEKGRRKALSISPMEDMDHDVAIGA